jgi:hypothetical protein
VTAIEELAAQADKTRRDRWGRYLVVPPKGGKPVGYTRVSTIAKTLDDGTALGPWKATASVVGAFRRPGLMARWQALIAEHADPWYGSDQSKAECKRLVEECMQAGGSTDRASIGSSLHKLCELHDLGASPMVVDPTTAADLAAYREAVTAAGITFDADGIERTVVLDDHQVAGMVDRHAVKVPGRRLPVIADLKTGSSLDFSGGSIAVQLAAYANASAGYVQGARASGADDARIALPAVDREVALVIHLPAGEARCVLQWIDIAKGWDAFQQAMAVREWRKESRRLFAPFVPTAHNSVGVVTTHSPAPSAPPLPAGTDVLPPSAPALAPSAEQPAGSPYVPPLPTGEAPFVLARREVDEGGKVDEPTVAILKAAYAVLPLAVRTELGELWADATQAGYSFHLRGAPTVRRFEIVRALVAHDWEHDAGRAYLRAACAYVVGQEYPLFPTVPLGAAIGSMDAGEAKRFAVLVTDPVAVRFDGTVMRLDLDAAA